MKLLYKKEQLILLSIDMLEQDDNRTEVSNTMSNDAGILRYQVRVMAPGVGINVVDHTLAASTDCKIVSISRQLLKDTDLYDSNFWTVVFDTDSCPGQLRDVTHISTKSHTLYLHHFQRHPRILCFQCYHPEHTQAKCTTAPGTQLRKHCRNFDHPIETTPMPTNLAVTYMTIEERLAMVDELSAKTDARTLALRSQADKVPLLSEAECLPGPAPSNTITQADASTAASTVPQQLEVSSEYKQACKLSDAAWMDPMQHKKKKIKAQTATPTESGPKAHHQHKQATKREEVKNGNYAHGNSTEPKAKAVGKDKLGSAGNGSKKADGSKALLAEKEKKAAANKSSAKLGSKTTDSSAATTKVSAYDTRMRKEAALAAVLRGEALPAQKYEDGGKRVPAVAEPEPAAEEGGKEPETQPTKLDMAILALAAANADKHAAEAEEAAATTEAEKAKKMFHNAAAQAHMDALAKEVAASGGDAANGSITNLSSSQKSAA